MTANLAVLAKTDFKSLLGPQSMKLDIRPQPQTSSSKSGSTVFHWTPKTTEPPIYRNISCSGSSSWPTLKRPADSQHCTKPSTYGCLICYFTDIIPT